MDLNQLMLPKLSESLLDLILQLKLLSINQTLNQEFP
jgi:hypothetical protein